MNAGFEMIWCNFNSTSLKLVSNLNVSAPLLNATGDQRLRTSHPSDGQLPIHATLNEPSVLDEGPHGPGMTNPLEPFRSIAQYMWFTASAKRYGSNGNIEVGGGETRVKINTCGLFSFYDPVLSGQSSVRVQQERKDLNLTADGHWQGPTSADDNRVKALSQLLWRRRLHHTNHVTEQDGLKMYDLVEDGLQNVLNVTGCTGISWDTLAKEVTTFYARHMHELRTVLDTAADSTGSSFDDQKQQLQQIRYLTHWFMVSYFEYPAEPYTPESLDKNFSIDSPAAKEGLSRCLTQYAVEDRSTLNNAEQLLSWAVDEALKGICTSIFSIGLAVERQWLLNYNVATEVVQIMGSQRHDLQKKARTWLDELEELMAWLGWIDQWTACEKGCTADVCSRTSCVLLTCNADRVLVAGDMLHPNVAS
jgi:hypothetical protein